MKTFSLASSCLRERRGGRPVGVAVAQDGSLFVSDDGSGSIWRVQLYRQVKLLI